jgi:hypothetical protein
MMYKRTDSKRIVATERAVHRGVQGEGSAAG